MDVWIDRQRQAAGDRNHLLMGSRRRPGTPHGWTPTTVPEVPLVARLQRADLRRTDCLVRPAVDAVPLSGCVVLRASRGGAGARSDRRGAGDLLAAIPVRRSTARTPVGLQFEV